MTDIKRVTKLEAAQRQLNSAIDLMFSGADEVAVHTLIGAASILLTDLIELHAPDRSWDRQAQEANNLTPAKYFGIMREAQNFLKHAREDASATLDFDPVDSESLAFWAVMNSSEIAAMSTEMQVFQLWYIASHYPIEDPTATPLKEAIALFGDLRGIPRRQRLNFAQRVLREQRAIQGAA